MKWSERMEAEDWKGMTDDVDLAERYGVEFWKRRKQVPPEWIEKLNEVAGFEVPVLYKGKRKFEELPGDQGENAKWIVAECAKVVEEQRASALKVYMDNIKHSMKGLMRLDLQSSC